eukprot:snap_masked-scaffold_1-processed-gene-17.39-mRNA-1 protein AED:1.00 eAED:1.00 QI:0/0/0/0/1/1/5/0/88
MSKKSIPALKLYKDDVAHRCRENHFLSFKILNVSFSPPKYTIERTKILFDGCDLNKSKSDSLFQDFFLNAKDLGFKLFVNTVETCLKV